MHESRYACDFAGVPLVFRTTTLADQANGAILTTLGETTVLATACMSKDPKPGATDLPLVVDFEERMYASGLILGAQYTHRELRPTDEAILSARMIDRAIRPYFEVGIRNEIQIVVTVLAYDGKNDPGITGLIATSAALAISDIPWGGPIAAIRSGWSDGRVVLHAREHVGASTALVTAGTAKEISMLEGKVQNEPSERVLRIIRESHAALTPVLETIDQLKRERSKDKRPIRISGREPELRELYKHGAYAERTSRAIEAKNPALIAELATEFEQTATLSREELANGAHTFFTTQTREIVANTAHRENRVDGRKTTDIRPIHIQTSTLSELLHGDATFVRGGTHVAGIVTLAPEGRELTIETIEERRKKRFFLHYNYPPFASGTTGRINTNRRAIGHGMLAENAILPLLPDPESFPFIIRVVSEVWASNGSSSMASVCAGSLALFDAGVQMKSHVAGVSIGITSAGKLLTDICGEEDAYGLMDCKVAGTREGITAIQMDVKERGVTIDDLPEIFARAGSARNTIIAQMEEAMPRPRAHTKPTAPIIQTVPITKETIITLLENRGGRIRQIEEATGASIRVAGNEISVIANRARGDDAIKQIRAINFETAR